MRSAACIASPELDARASAARIAGALVGASRGQRVADRADRHARGPRDLLLPVRGHGSRISVSRRCSRTACPATGAAHVQPDRQRLRLRPAVADAGARCTLGELGKLLAAPDVEADILAGLNAAELGRRQFREIARIAGLIFQGYPGEPNPARQLQASSALLYEVFAEYDPDNLAAAAGGARSAGAAARGAAHRDRRSRACAAAARWLTRPARPTPFAFPLLVEMFREELSTEVARRARRADGRGARSLGIGVGCVTTGGAARCRRGITPPSAADRDASECDGAATLEREDLPRVVGRRDVESHAPR